MHPAAEPWLEDAAVKIVLNFDPSVFQLSYGCRRRRVALKKNWLRLMHVARLNDAARRTYGLEAASKQCVGIYRISAASAASYVNVATRP